MKKLSQSIALMMLGIASFMVYAADPYVRVPYLVRNLIPVYPPPEFKPPEKYSYAGLTPQQGSKFDGSTASIYIQGTYAKSLTSYEQTNRDGIMEIVASPRYMTNGIIANLRMTNSSKIGITEAVQCYLTKDPANFDIKKIRRVEFWIDTNPSNYNEIKCFVGVY